MIIATNNQGKLNEFRAMLASIPQINNEITSLADYPHLPEVEETGTTFEANARLKAETIAELTGEMTLADDSGLVVHGLGGEPGIYSARYSGPGHNDQANNEKLLSEMAKRCPKDRSAQFVCCIVVAYPNCPSLVVTGTVDGVIEEQLSGEGGFGYDPLFYYPPAQQTFGEMSADEKNQVSHRAQAMELLQKALPQWIKENQIR